VGVKLTNVEISTQTEVSVTELTIHGNSMYGL